MIYFRIGLIILYFSRSNGFVFQPEKIFARNFTSSVTIENNELLEEIISCDQCGFESRHRIVGGRDALANEFPWLVVVKYWHLKYCSGSLINDRYVLTAAHCVDRKFVQLFSVAMYENNVIDSMLEILFPVENVVLHSKFDPDTFDYDIALLRLKQKVSFGLFLRPVCLPNANTNFTGTNATVVGWGAILENGDGLSNERLHKLEVPVVSNAECKDSNGLKPYLITRRMLCAGFLEGGKDACQGDSGGPLLIKMNGRWVQIGIVSWGVGCARPDHYGVYTKITEFREWIIQNLGNPWSC